MMDEKESSLLLKGYGRPLIFNVCLAKVLGLNEAIVLQQVHYWLDKNEEKDNNFKEGYYWVYNSYDEWQRQFPFWSLSTIQRTIRNLEKLKVLISGRYNKMKIDKTKWYRIDYDYLEILIKQNLDKKTKAYAENNSKDQGQAINMEEELHQSTKHLKLSEDIIDLINKQHDKKIEELNATSSDDTKFSFSYDNLLKLNAFKSYKEKINPSDSQVLEMVELLNRYGEGKLSVAINAGLMAFANKSTDNYYDVFKNKLFSLVNN